jgi:tRNA threonylcarbamoyl adenosine modification protein (Sua5/YciO/YrdC/YwlC family)
VSTVDEVAGAVEAGQLVVVPTDTVYGLACRPDSEDAVRSLSALKRRSVGQPIALVAASVDAAAELVPEIAGCSVPRGALTVVLPNPLGRLPWLAGMRPDTIGVRIPDVAGIAAELLSQVGAIAATSANVHGGVDPRRLGDVPGEILDAVGAILDGGDLPGAPSTVVDLTGPEPRVLREGAVPSAEALAQVGQ